MHQPIQGKICMIFITASWYSIIDELQSTCIASAALLAGGLLTLLAGSATMQGTSTDTFFISYVGVALWS